jgi:hypothetical protein
VKPGFACSVSIFTVEIMALFCYFGSFPSDVGTVGPHTGYGLCSYEVDAVFSFCGVFGYRCSLILQSSVSGVFGNPLGDVATLLADVYLTT